MASGDSLTGRIDYGIVRDEAIAVFTRAPRKILEAVAADVADAVFGRHHPMRRLVVRVRKVPPFWRGRIAYVEVEVERRR